MWKTIDRPGYFGKKRNELEEKWNLKYGNNWRIAWEFGSQILARPEALQIYEDGYYEHFKRRPALLNQLITTASNVYDTAPSNHLHDIAIRRSVLRLGTWFQGSELLEIRSQNEKGWIFSPCNIPFHLPHLIYKGQTKYQGESRDFAANPPWWIKSGVENSVEEFYQQNKLLQIRI